MNILHLFSNKVFFHKYLKWPKSFQFLNLVIEVSQVIIAQYPFNESFGKTGEKSLDLLL